MIDQEVMELMQRYIDGDLDQQETSLMMDHVGESPECAAMLAKLQNLSDNLEQLPRVVPPFSIVDSILPKLEQLRSAAAAESASEPAPVSAPLAASAASEPEKAAPAGLPVRSRRPARDMYRRLAAVVSLGVVAGLLLFGNPSEWIPSFDGVVNDSANAPAAKREMADNSAASEMAEDQSAELKIMFNEEISPEDSAAPEEGSANLSIASDPAEVPDSPAPSAEAQTGGGSGDGASGGALSGPSASSPPSDGAQAAVEPSSAPSAAASAAPQSEAPTATEKVADDPNRMTVDDKATEGSSSIPNLELAPVESAGSPAVGSAASPSAAPAASPAASPAAAPQPTLNAIPAEAALSPDGQWRAQTIAGTGTLEIYRTADESLLYHSEPREGTVSHFAWNENSTVLYFTYTNPDGQQTPSQYDIVNTTESSR